MRLLTSTILGLLVCCTTARLSICGAKGPQALRNKYNETGGGGLSLLPMWPELFTIKVYFHIITSTTEEHGLYHPYMLAKQMDVLNTGFAHGKYTPLRRAKFKFTLAGVTRTVNYNWAHDNPNDYKTDWSPNEKQYKKALRKGGYSDVNVYILSHMHEGELLGIATYPRAEPIRWADGIILLASTMPGGSKEGFDQGKTLVHEMGHWLGLYHTFGTGCGDGPCSCDGPGDYVDDTTVGIHVYRGDCTAAVNSCPDHVGYDDISNYMNYGKDVCDMHFTALQGQRMRVLYGNLRWKR
ncbi:unnamed protein product [Cercospora beticola]|nr:unnamed protein product [Cercospora beticola]